MPRLSGATTKEKWEMLLDSDDKYSLKHMNLLCDLCELYASKITPKTQELMVETLRQLAELILWGDQHDPQFFDIFLEKTVLTHLMQVLHQDIVQVKIQLLQTLSILIQNLKSEMALFYLLSNNYINDLITYKWDFTNEDVLTNYVSFLKTISLKLNPKTIQFFFNGMKNTFPLYTEAITFHDNKESMVRIAVRTLSLNVYKVNDALMQKFLIEKTARYISNIILSIVRLCKRANTVLEKESFSEGQLQDIMEELLDIFYYLHDVLSLNLEKMGCIITYHLVEYLIIPIFAGNLRKSETNPPVRLKKSLVLFLVAQFFYIFTHGALVTAAGAVLVHPKPQQYHSLYNLIPQLKQFNHPPDFTSLEKPPIEKTSQQPSHIDALYSTMVKPTPKGDIPKPRLPTELFSVREDLLESLKSSDDQIILGTLCVLYSIMRNASCERKLLSQAAMFPHRLEKVQSLFESLVSDNSSELFGDSSSDLFGDVGDKAKEIPKDCNNTQIVDYLLEVLLHGERYRIVTLEIALLVFKELVYSETQQPKLTTSQKELFEDAYKVSTSNLRDRLVDSEVGEVFLELFEDEMKSFKPVHFDSLVTDYSILCHIPEGPTRGVSFTMRLPLGNLEETKKAVQGFLLMRKLKFTFQKQKDTLLPLKESKSNQTKNSLEEGSVIHCNSRKDDDWFTCIITSINGFGKRMLIMEGPYLLAVQKTEGANGESVVVRELLDLQNIEVAISRGDPNVLLTKAGTMKFESEEQCLQVKTWVETGKQRVRYQKLEQLYELLGIDNTSAKNISRRKSTPIVCDAQAKPFPLDDNLDDD